MRWNRSDRVSAVESSKTFVAVLDTDGNMIDSDADANEAYLKAEHASPTGTVAIDATVFSDERDSVGNPPGALKQATDTALRASEIDPVSLNWRNFNPDSELGKKTIKVAREALRDLGEDIYQELLDDVRGLQVYEPQRRGEKKKHGGIAASFDPAWLTGEMLRQNQKMQKVLGGAGDVEYDSIGLSLLPHGASFRDPFSQSTDQGPGGVTFCKFSTAECRKVCLVNTGQRALESGAFAAGYLFSALIRQLPREFFINLFDRCLHEFEAAQREGFRRFIRLNVLSDLPWERLAPGFLEAVCEMARKRHLGSRKHRMTDGLAFYDYTKIPYRRGIDGYYDLTFSFSGSKGMYPAVFDVLEDDAKSARRTAVVFVKREEKPVKKTGAMYRQAPGKPLSSDEPWHAWTFLGERVWNGELSDVRPLDPREVKIVGLTYKPARYKIAPTRRGKKFDLVPVVDSTELDKELPTFLVRVRQPDPDAPPVVVAQTQDPANRKLELPTWKE